MSVPATTERTSVLARFATLGDRPEDGPSEQLRHRVLVYMGLLMSGGGLVWGVAAEVAGLPRSALIPFAYPVVTAINFLVFWRTKHFGRARLVQVLASLLLPFALQWSLGGFGPSGAVMLWAMMAMVGGTATTEHRGGAFWLLPFVALTVLSAVIDSRLVGEASPSATVRTVFLVANITVPISCVFGLTVYLLSSRQVAHASLERANRALAQAMEAAGAASRAKSEFVANMSHGIRTPLNGVVGLLQALARTRLDREQQHYVRTMEGAADALMAVVNQVLDFSSLQASSEPLAVEPIDAVAIAEEVVARLAVRAHEHGVDVGVVATPAPGRTVLPSAMARAEALTQVLTNLVGNAIKFTRVGTVTVEIATTSDERALTLTVRDTGPGIAPSLLGSLFDPFVTASPSDPTRVGSAGTGLGLAIAKSLVERMGGRIGVESTVGKGSAFVVELEAAPRRPAAPAEIRSRRLANEGAWLVGLEPGLVRRALESQLLALGMPARALSVAEASEKARTSAPPRLVLGTDASAMDSLARQLAVERLQPGAEMPAIFVVRRIGADERDVPEVVSSLRVPTTRKWLREAASRQDAASVHAVTSARPMRVLVVEDNPVNRDVAAALLGALGMTSEFATDGAGAVELTASREFDVVLMDCQMPVMDGYEATRAIRARENDRGLRRVPIVAVTAHVGPEHRLRSVEAGMDEHLTKPIRLDALREALAPFERVVDGPRPAAPVAAPASHEEETLVDQSQLRQLRELLGREGLASLVDKLEVSFAQARERWARAVAASPIDREEIGAAAHRVRGALMALAATHGASAALEVERSAPEAEPAALREAIERFEALEVPTLRALRAGPA